MPPHRLTRMGSLLLIAALAGTGCSDQTGPTASETGETAVSRPGSNPARSGTTFISDLRVHSNAVFMSLNSSSGGWVDLDVGLTNPGRKATGLYLQGVVRQGLLTATTNQVPIRCTAVEGTMPRGTCTMPLELAVPYRNFFASEGQFTLKLLKRHLDNSITVLDSRTVDVVIVRL